MRVVYPTLDGGQPTQGGCIPLLLCPPLGEIRAPTGLSFVLCPTVLK